MKGVSTVAIFGKQNVGKSTLFNALTRSHQAIVEDIPGVTRDVLKKPVTDKQGNVQYLLSDTPGLDIDPKEVLQESILKQATEFLDTVALLVHVVDVQNIERIDTDLISWIRKHPKLSKKPILYVANKVDSHNDLEKLNLLFEFGLQHVVPISARGRSNLDELQKEILSLIPKSAFAEEAAPDFKLAIVGKPNSGKSSILNKLLGFERSIVSEISGTTRDAVSERISFESLEIEIVDTAGIRKKSKESESVEFFSYNRTLHAIEASDIILLIIDAVKGVGEFDKKLLSDLEEQGKPTIIIFNKWDLIENKDSKTEKEYFEKAINRLPVLNRYTKLTTSASQHQRIHKILQLAADLRKRSTEKITTGELNRSLKLWTGLQKHSNKKAPKILYATQTSMNPCKFLFFVNDTELFQKDLSKFYETKLRKEFQLEGIPIEIEFRSDRRKILSSQKASPKDQEMDREQKKTPFPKKSQKNFRNAKNPKQKQSSPISKSRNKERKK